MFKTKAVVMALVVAGSLTGGSACAGDMARNRMEKAQDRRELRQDARQTFDDRMDVAKLENALVQLDRARAADRAGAVAKVDQMVLELLRQEGMETRVEVAQKAGEIRRDNAELRSDAREVRQDVAAGTPVKAAGDIRDLRDDRRDKRDDQRDLARELGQASRRHQLAAEYRGLVGKEDPVSLDRRRAVLTELVGIARAEVRGDVREVREDRRELREDRRETREDRRDRR